MHFFFQEKKYFVQKKTLFRHKTPFNCLFIYTVWISYTTPSYRLIGQMWDGGGGSVVEWLALTTSSIVTTIFILLHRLNSSQDCFLFPRQRNLMLNIVTILFLTLDLQHETNFHSFPICQKWCKQAMRFHQFGNESVLAKLDQIIQI